MIGLMGYGLLASLALWFAFGLGYIVGVERGKGQR